MTNFTESNQSYAKFMINDEDEDLWSQFTGRCLLFGIKQNKSIEHILEYIFETYHVGIERQNIPTSINKINEDIIDFLEHMDQL
ncbi:hypothetical protein HN385_06020 [archaeon]|jgi:hypothetical protein|nr:hypothetical protein [archaeon]